MRLQRVFLDDQCCVQRTLSMYTGQESSCCALNLSGSSELLNQCLGHVKLFNVDLYSPRGGQKLPGELVLHVAPEARLDSRGGGRLRLRSSLYNYFFE